MRCNAIIQKCGLKFQPKISAKPKLSHKRISATLRNGVLAMQKEIRGRIRLTLL